MLSIVDRHDTSNIKHMDRMVVELSKYMTELEIDRCVDFLNTISTSKFDINPTPQDAASQMRILLGEQRYYTIKMLWSRDNQHLVKNTDNKVKYICKKTKTIYDGLDPQDNPQDYEVIRM